MMLNEQGRASDESGCVHEDFMFKTAPDDDDPRTASSAGARRITV
jgi:hypothetical protein